jgi:putative transposase
LERKVVQYVSEHYGLSLQRAWLEKNQTYSLYCKEQLQLRSKRPKQRKMAVGRVSRITPRRPN